MIRAQQIPDEVVEAAAMQLPGMSGHQRYVRAAIAAALNAWPGAYPFDYGAVEAARAAAIRALKDR